MSFFTSKALWAEEKQYQSLDKDNEIIKNGLTSRKF
jgi:hypothetical protein